VFKFGRKIFKEVEDRLEWRVIGVIPDYKNEGYIFLHINETLKIYKYDLQKIYQENENFVGINFEFIKEDKTLFRNYEDIKLSLIKERQDMPTPLTLSIDVPYYPVEETIIPIVKRLAAIKISKLENTI
jgi:hypothetical protein